MGRYAGHQSGCGTPGSARPSRAAALGPDAIAGDRQALQDVHRSALAHDRIDHALEPASVISFAVRTLPRRRSSRPGSPLRRRYLELGASEPEPPGACRPGRR